MTLPVRILLTVLLLSAVYAADIALNIITAQTVAPMAGDQFLNSDFSYWRAHLAIRGSASIYFALWIVGLGLLILLWKSYLRQAVIAIGGLFCFMLAMIPGNAWAYYDKTNWPEVVMIMPNESAFWIPETGANQDTQTKFGSVEYYQKNKLAVKRFEIPHAKLSGSSYWSDYYIPAGRLIIVPREPYNSTWTKSSGTGTSSKDQSFTCQSLEGLNVTAEMTIGAFVAEDDAPKYLYWFPVRNPAGNRSEPAVIFTSVYYAASLKETMDTVIWGAVSKFFCHEIGTRTLDQANTDATKILKAAEDATRAYMATRGITLDYLGMAGTFTFDPPVQKAINDLYEAQKIQPALEVLKVKALFDLAHKWDGKMPSLPSVVVLPSNLTDIVTGLSKPALEKR